MPVIDIRLIRNNADKNTDDIITLETADFSQFIVTYHEYSLEEKLCFRTSQSGVIDYVYNLLDLLVMDEDPFSTLQLDAPMYPTVILSVSKLKKRKIADTVIRIIRKSVDNWPQIT